MPDLTPIATEQQALRNYHDQWEIDQLTAAAFAVRGYRTCACGSTIEERGATACYPCRWQNRRASLYGVLAESEATVGAAVSVTGHYDHQAGAVGTDERKRQDDLATGQKARIAALEAENRALAERVVQLMGQLALRSR